MINVKSTEEMGRGIYANGLIKAGKVVQLCELLVLDEIDTLKVNSTSLQYYTFKFTDTQDCLVLGLGEIFNHDDKPNVSYKLIQVDGRFMMEFKTLQDVEAGSQLFIDYTADTAVNVSKYVQSGSLVG